MAETLSIISIISFVAAGVFLAIAIVLFTVFKIPSVIGDLSGRNARKSIEQIRKNNEKSDNNTYRPGDINHSRVDVSNFVYRDTGRHNRIVETGLLNEGQRKGGGFANETTPLYEDYETWHSYSENETVPLSEMSKVMAKKQTKKTGGKKIELLEEIMLIHTNEIAK